jgi:hypothetical protein
MWLLTTRGFYSAVATKDDPDTIVVRARVRADLEALRGLVGDPEILEGVGTDYRYRVRVSRARWEAAVTELAREIDYTNFKNAVSDRQGASRAHTYSEVWHTLHELQR